MEGQSLYTRRVRYIPQIVPPRPTNQLKHQQWDTFANCRIGPMWDFVRGAEGGMTTYTINTPSTTVTAEDDKSSTLNIDICRA